MKKLTTKIITLIAFTAMMLTITPMINIQSVQAASKAQGTVDLKAKKLIIPKGKTQKIKNKTLTMVKSRRYQIKTKFGATTVTKTGTYKSSKPAVATVSATGLVTAKAAGTTTIKVTYNGKSQTFKIKVINAHTHTLKTVKKATCASKGTKLCTTCGATGTIKKSTKHSFVTTKKATCETKGVETCSVCGLKNTLPKTAHKYKTDKFTTIEGRGKKWHATTIYCPGCRQDMTDWTNEQRHAHQLHVDAIDAGLISEDCWNSGTDGSVGGLRYAKYVKVEVIDTYCENCGAGEDAVKTRKDLYYVDAKKNKISADEDPWYVYSYENYMKEHGFVPCEQCHLEVIPGHECQECHILAPEASAKKATAKAVTDAQDVIVNSEEINADIDNSVIVSENETVSENAIISDNSVSDNNTEITDSNGSGDFVFNDTNG